MEEECPVCNNKKIIQIGEQGIEVELSVATGKIIKRGKAGTWIWWRYKCKCGWESETLTE